VAPAKRYCVLPMLAATLAAGLACAGFALGAGRSGATPLGALTDTVPEPAPTTTPTPDPAPVPAPKPKPKPAPKPAPKPQVTHSTPTTAPSVATPTPTYTPPAAPTSTHDAKPTSAKHPRRRHPQKAATNAVKEQPASTRLPFAGAPIEAQPTAATTLSKPRDPAKLLLVGGVAAALLFIVIATWVPSSRLRTTAAGRIAFDHQIDLVITGIAVLFVSVVVYLMTRA
jgi:hypothetical protein